MYAHAPSKRDTRIDVLRALALLTIFVDHIPGTPFENWTYQNLGFSDAAEAFVLISGMAVALAYGAKFGAGNWLLPSIKMWRRASVLYASHIVATVATLGIFCAGAVFAKRPELLTQINIAPVIDKTPEALIGIATLGHQLGYNNILPLYAVLLLGTPLILALTRLGLRLTILVSAVIWLVAGVWRIAPPNYPEPGYWFLNPLSWQFLFVIGLCTTLHVRRGGSIPVTPWLIRLAALYAGISFLWIHSPLWGQITWFGLPPVLGGFDKTFLSLSRLTHILAIAYLIAAIPAVSNLVRTRPDNPLAILGKRSLPIFIAGTILAMLIQVLKVIHPGGLALDFILVATGIAMQFMLAYYLEWLAGKRNEGQRRLPASLLQAPPRLQPADASH